MGLFKQNKNNVKSIFTNDITANQNYIFVKNGFIVYLKSDKIYIYWRDLYEKCGNR